MREICTSGLMSGEGKRSASIRATAPLLDSTFLREEGGAPMVLAKGKDLVALKIREVAERHGVPVLERKELARAMYDFVEVDKMIPQEFYRPVAELIHYLDALATRRH